MSEVSPEANRRILVVDDNPAIHDDFRKILALVNDATELDLEEAAVFGEPAPAKWQEPFEIDSAYQGAEAVELLRKANELGRPYAMAFVDMRMPPGMNGLETIARLWALSSELQVVICTAYSDHSWREMIQSLGKTDRLLILKKPFDPIEVLQLAHAVTSKWQLGRQVRNRVEDLELRVAERTRELLSANEKLGEQAALLDHARDAILVRDMADRLLYWNRSAETLYEWPAAQAIGRGESTLFQCDKRMFIEAKRSTLGSGAWLGDLVQQTKGGRELIVESRWTLVRDELGQPHSILVINTDVTEARRVHANFLRAQRMESIGVLAAGMAHDLNNILQPISMAMGVVRSRISDSVSRGMLDMVAANTRRATSLVSQVLAFGRGMEGNHAPIVARSFVGEIVRMIQKTFPKNIEIRERSGENETRLSGDVTQLSQVLLNLCLNARDAMPHGGLLEVGVQNVSISESDARLHLDARPGPYVAISVTDTGSGIPVALRDKIFDPFFTTKEQGKGTGLGLSTSLGIMRGHRGFMTLTSAEGSGSTFRFFVPAAPDDQTQQGQDLPGPDWRGQNELLLVAEAEGAARELLGALLRKHGYRVLLCSDGAEVVALFAQNLGQVAAVVTVATMPLLDGPPLMVALQKLDPSLKVIVIANDAPAQKLHGLRSLGIRHFLSKPYPAEELLRGLRELLDEPAS